jgi:hypothetical protein
MVLVSRPDRWTRVNSVLTVGSLVTLGTLPHTTPVRKQLG